MLARARCLLHTAVRHLLGCWCCTVTQQQPHMHCLRCSPPVQVAGKAIENERNPPPEPPKHLKVSPLPPSRALAQAPTPPPSADRDPTPSDAPRARQALSLCASELLMSAMGHPPPWCGFCPHLQMSPAPCWCVRFPALVMIAPVCSCWHAACSWHAPAQSAVTLPLTVQPNAHKSLLCAQCMVSRAACRASAACRDLQLPS